MSEKTDVPKVTGQQNENANKTKSVAEETADLTRQVAESRTLSNEQLLRQEKIIENINRKLEQGLEVQKAMFSQYQVGITEFVQDYKNALDEQGRISKENQEQLFNDFKENFKGSQAIAEKITELAAKGDFKGIEKLKGDLAEAKKQTEAFDRGITGLTSKLGMAAKFSDTFVGSIYEQAIAFGELEPEAQAEAFNGMKESMLQATSGGVILGAVIGKLASLAMEAFDAMNQLTNTFGTDQFAGSVTAASTETQKFGGTLKETGAILNTMGKEFSEFNFLNDTMKGKIAANSLTLERLGISASTSGKMLNPLVKGIGMTADAASNLQVSIAASAAGFGKSSEQMMQDFSTAMESIIYAGEGAVAIFEGIAKEAARTGIAVNKLMTVTSAFDKFSGAADKAAQLNALFGTSLSAMGMHAMDEGQRLEELKRQFQGAGMTADSLNKYQLKALADTLGVSMPEALQMLGGELSEQQKEQMKMAKASEELNQTMGKLTLAALPLVKQIEALFSSMFTNKDTINTIVNGIKTLSFVIVSAMEHINVLIAAFSLFAAIRIVSFLITTAQGIFGIGLASKFAFGKIVFIVTIFAALYAILHRKGSPELYLLFGVVALGIIAIGIAAMVAKPGMDTLALVFLAVGFAALGIFYGFKMVIDAFTNMIVKTAEFADIIPTMALSVLGLAAGLYLLGGAGVFAMAGMVMAAIGLFAILAAFSLTGQSVGDFIKGGGDEIAKIGAGIAAFGGGMEKLMTVASKIKNTMGDTALIASMQGDKMSLVVGKDAGVATLFKNDTLNIKVDMPTINIPKPNFKVYIDGKEIKAIVEDMDNRNTQ